MPDRVSALRLSRRQALGAGLAAAVTPLFGLHPLGVPSSPPSPEKIRGAATRPSGQLGPSSTSSGFVDLADIRLYYEVTGDGPALLFAHGSGGNHLSWWQQVPYFHNNYRCITFDQRGLGRSLDAPDGPGTGAFVADAVALLDHLGVAECSVVAQSVGGVTGFGLALSQPDRIKALVMADTIRGIPSNSLREFEQRLIAEGRAETGHVFHPTFGSREPARTFLYWQIDGMNPPGRSGPRRRRQPRDEDLSGFRVPTLFLFGTEDAMMPVELGRLAQQLVPGARYAEVENAGHSLYWEQPDEFNRAVSDFLDDSLS